MDLYNTSNEILIKYKHLTRYLGGGEDTLIWVGSDFFLFSLHPPPPARYAQGMCHSAEHTQSRHQIFCQQPEFCQLRSSRGHCYINKIKNVKKKTLGTFCSTAGLGNQFANFQKWFFGIWIWCTSLWISIKTEFLESESDVWHIQPTSINVEKFVEMVGTSYLMFANLAVTT